MNESYTFMQNLNRVALAAAVCFLTLTSAFAHSNESRDLMTNQTLVRSAAEPVVKFERIWVDYDVNEGGENGMRIHLKFTTEGLKGVDTAVRIYFQTADGKNLMDKNNKFNSQAGYVSLFQDLKPGYDKTSYNDLTMFMPYAELELAEGLHKLRMDVDVIYADGTLIQHMTFEPFTYTKEAAGPNATVKRVWVEYNVTEGGRKGIRIHVNFEVSGLKGIDTQLAVRVQKADDTFLLSSSPTFSNSEGQLEVVFEMRPGYPVTAYEDAALFVPYNEIKLRKGNYDLKFDIDLNYDNGELIKHLHLEEFSFTQP